MQILSLHPTITECVSGLYLCSPGEINAADYAQGPEMASRRQVSLRIREAKDAARCAEARQYARLAGPRRRFAHVAHARAPRQVAHSAPPCCACPLGARPPSSCQAIATGLGRWME
eukprot:6184720-Pleurochrysis_carterae.AAC.1